MTKHKILIIDSDPTLRLIAEKILTKHNYTIISAGSGETGIRLFMEGHPDLVILDYNLPDISGIDVCKQIRHTPAIDNIPILFITSNEDAEAIESAFNVGATDFSNKPLNWNILIYRIQYMLRAHQVNKSLLSSEHQLTKAQKIAKIANWEYISADDTFKWSDGIYDILESPEKQTKLNDFSGFFQFVSAKDKEKLQLAMHNCLENHVGFKLDHDITTLKGNVKNISHNGNVIKNNDESTNCIGTLQDVSEQKKTEEQLRSLEYYDSLTGLMNRESFLTGIDQILASDISYNLISALLFIDLDDFKRINETFGHTLGDTLLCNTAHQLQACVRTAEKNKAYRSDHRRLLNNEIPDRLMRLNTADISRFDLGRLGGDEFLIFLADIPSEKVAASIARRILKTLEKPFTLDGHEIYISSSIGIAIAPRNGDTIQTLLKNADSAMYNTKANGKNNFQFYNQSMNEQSLKRLMLETDLRKAIDNNELYLVYQPQFNLQTGKLIGAEVLMRWLHHAEGRISPAEFIPIAEGSGQILKIGNWLFKQFSKTLLEWKQHDLIPSDFKLAINVSSLQFYQSDLIEKVQHYFPDHKLNKNVEFELTESVMMRNTSTNLNKLNQIIENNISLSIDDFGTGYSSLSYLHRFPVDTVKIDRSFIENMDDPGQANIIKAIINMAHGMNIKVIAEGIENQWQQTDLKEKNCDIGQGFFLSKPLNKEKFQQLLMKWAR